MINSIKQLDSMFQKLEKQFKEIVAKVKVIEEKIVALANTDKVNSTRIKELEAKNKSLEDYQKKSDKISAEKIKKT